MLTSLHFQNFRALRDAKVKLGRLNLIVGPNGCGKSTVFKALGAVKNGGQGVVYARALSVQAAVGDVIQLNFSAAIKSGAVSSFVQWESNGHIFKGMRNPNSPNAATAEFSAVLDWIQSLRIYALKAQSIAATVPLAPNAELQPDGSHLAAVLDNLRDNSPEDFVQLQKEVKHWLPEYNAILFDTPTQGHRAIKLRHAASGKTIPAADLSDGTLLALAILTIAHLPNPPKIVGFEEPDHGLHPRLLRVLRDALCRLAYPERFGLSRPLVQVIATTHSPYFLDLFKDSPEEVIIAQKQADGSSQFINLAEDKQLMEIIGDAPLGEVWFSGVLGGVPQI